MINDFIKMKGELILVLSNPEGNIKQSIIVPNLVVTTGKNYIADRMKNNSTVMSHMEVGTGTTSAAAGNTALVSAIGSSRTALASTTVTSNAVAYVCNFGAGVGTGAVTEAGITLPEGDFSWWGDDTPWRTDSTDKKNFYNKEILPKVEGYVKQILQDVGLDASYFGELDVEKLLKGEEVVGAFPVEMQDELVELIAKCIFGEKWSAISSKDVKNIIAEIVGIDPKEIGSKR